MRYIQLVIELYVPRNYAESFAPWCSSYTCKDKVSSQFMLSANKNGTLHDCISGFLHVRGITKDKNGYYYVVEHSPKHHVIKFDSDWKPLRKSNKDAIGLLFDPHGIYINKDN